ncbi:MAG: ribosomal protein L4 [Parcubacteria bacterium C7867-005]|nr:MAG: ribosomal protein L4 [Parcubacteria bacterium C7867-005]
MEAKVYTIKAKEANTISLPEGLFGLNWNSDLVHQVATSLESAKRKPIAHTKNRSEVRGGGKKPWQQKGTGRARHGSIRSPLWVGGGITHGPRNEKNFDRKVSKKMKAKAFYTILSRKFKDGEILFVDSIALSMPKTKEAIGALKGLSGVKGFENLFTKKNNSAIIALADKNQNVERSMSNLGNMEVLEARNLHPLALLKYKYLIIENPSKSLELLPGNNIFAKEKVAKVAKKTTTKAKKVVKA